MEFAGPLTIQSSDNSRSGNRELHFSFTPEFKSFDHTKRVEVFKTYITSLTEQSNSSDDHATKQGLLLVLQFSQQLLPHLEIDEIPLEEIIVVELTAEDQGHLITDLLNNHTLN